MVPARAAGMRLDAFMAAEGLYPTRSAAAKCIDEGGVTLNGRPARKSTCVQAGDTLQYRSAPDTPVSSIPQPAAIPLDIRYEDESLLVISKQAGLVCHPSMNHTGDTLVNALVAHCGAENLCDVQGNHERLGIVHRLDRDTSGLMLCAKTDEVGYSLMESIRTRSVDRHYLALVHGWIALNTGLVDAPIARGERDRTRMSVSDREDARPSVTTFEVLRRFEPGKNDDGFTLIDCKLFTGRTHQIRVHMEYIQHPCVGDPVYGAGKKEDLGLTRQFLHSYRLSFTHPVTEERLEFDSALPPDLQQVIDDLEKRG